MKTIVGIRKCKYANLQDCDKVDYVGSAPASKRDDQPTEVNPTTT